MRLLFFVKQTKLLRHFEETLRLVADAGHDVVVAAPAGKAKPWLPPKLRKHRRILLEPYGDAMTTESNALMLLRLGGDYLRYLEPPASLGSFNRQRMLDRLLASASDGTRRRDPAWPDPLPLNRREHQVLRSALRAVDAAVPADPSVRDFIAHVRPDAVLVTPLVTSGSAQIEIVKASKELGIPCGFPIFSWDNLSNKGLIHVLPDRVFAWNETQRQEAVEMHGAAPESVVITGAPRFDEFFAMRPSVDRTAFCELYGLDPEQRLILYLASSPNVAPDERVVAERWLAGVRSSSESRLRDANVLVRPHPARNRLWEGWSSGFGRVAISSDPGKQADQGLFDALHHSAAAVGLNTSAQIEAAIVGRPVYSFAGGADAPGQEGSLHYRYLLREQGGFVDYADSLDEHLAQLADGLLGRFDRDARERFVASFVRPAGVERPASPLLAEALIELARTRERRRWPRLRRARATPVRASEPEPPHDVTVEVDYLPERVFIHAATPMEIKYRAHACAKEPWTISWLERELGDGDVLYDIGANVGVYALIAAKILRDRGIVVAFEPGYANYARLCENIRLNEVADRVVPVPVPLSSRAGLQSFSYRSLEAGQSRHSFEAATWRPGADGGNGDASEQPMLAFTLDDVTNGSTLPPPTLIKLDVDGAEQLVLEGAPETLARTELRSVLVEIDRELEDTVPKLLEAGGFELAERHQRAPTKPVYGVFVRR